MIMQLERQEHLQQAGLLDADLRGGLYETVLVQA
jgi:hypothetical protein